MAVAYFMAHGPKSFFPTVNGGDAAILYCFVFLFLVLAGPRTGRDRQAIDRNGRFLSRRLARAGGESARKVRSRGFDVLRQLGMLAD
jgi:hypothetical protein